MPPALGMPKLAVPQVEMSEAPPLHQVNGNGSTVQQVDLLHHF